jgi:hypothetical protein
VIKISQLMVLRSRISVILKISGHSKDDHTRPPQWLAALDIRWKLRHRRPSSASFVQDGLEHVAVGDPDPTADPGGAADGSGKCGFKWTHQRSRTLILPWSCTRTLGHQGQHLAGTGEWVAALHPQ